MIDFDKAFGRSPSVVESDVALKDVESEDFDVVVPKLEGDFSHFGDFELVGNGDVTSDRCGTFSGYFYGCDRVELHNKTDLNGINYAGKVFVKKAVLHGCNKPSCPTCFESWVIRGAMAIEARLKEGSKHFGQVEHLTLSVPEKDYSLPFERLREKAKLLLKARGVVGGCLIFHGGRYANPIEAERKGVVVGWRWSPHWHVLCYIFGGYRKCRRCPTKWDCKADCSGFDSRAWKAYLKDGYVTKVFGKRKSVFLTAKYQLSHATIKRDSVRFHCFTYFGNVAFREMKVTVEMRKAFCPLCEHDLLKLRYNGLDLHILYLLHVKNIWVPREEDADWSILEKEVVWERFVSSVSYGYGNEELD